MPLPDDFGVSIRQYLITLWRSCRICSALTVPRIDCALHCVYALIAFRMREKKNVWRINTCAYHSF